MSFELNPCQAKLTVLMCCVVTVGTTIPETTTTEVDTIPGESLRECFFPTDSTS